MLKISVRLCILALAVTSLFGCQRPANLDPAADEVETFTHAPGTCPNLPTGTYSIAGLPEGQRESIQVGPDNTFGHAVTLTVEGRWFEARPNGKLEKKDYGVGTADVIHFMAGCKDGALVVSYSGVANGKKVRGKKEIRAASGNSLQVTDAVAGRREYKRI